MSYDRRFEQLRHLRRHRRLDRKALLAMQERYRTELRLIASQLPALISIAIILLLQNMRGITSGSYAIIILILLTPVVYVPMKSGLRAGLLSAGLLTAFNIFLLFDNLSLPSITDPRVRTVALLGTVMFAGAAIIGRLKERNDLLLKREQAARLEAEANEQRLRFMAEAMPQKIFTSRPDGTTEYANHQWTEYTGASLESLQKENWANLIHPADSEENVRQWERCLKTGEPFEFEHRMKRADGEYRWHITRAQPMCDENGDITLWVGSSTDIEDIRRTRKLEADTARLSRQRAELLALNTAKDEFISLASHQLRTPATGVKQYLGMVLEGFGGKVPPRQRKLLKHAYESNERQLNIVDDLLKVAQVDAGKVKLQKDETDIVALIRDIIEGQSDKFAERRQTVIFKPRQRKVLATLDPGRIRMVIENIVDNASKYSPPDTKITIRLSKTKGRIALAISDEGVGIDPRYIHKIFDKFSRLNNPMSVLVGGTGLGLYWAKKIIDLHSGSIVVTSELRKGTTFTITLPC